MPPENTMVKITRFRIMLRPGSARRDSGYAMRNVIRTWTSVPTTVTPIVMARALGKTGVENTNR